MSKTNNSLLAKRVFEALYIVIGRRTLDSFAVQILKTTLEKLNTKYDFLHLVTIHDDFFSEDGIQASFDQTFDAIEPSRLGEAIDALIRGIYLELTETIGDDAGLYFITELKQHLGDAFVDELRGNGVYFERIQSEQHLRFHNNGSHSLPLPLQKKEQEEPPYTWEAVSTWKYDNNVCLLYDEQGSLLDKLQLDLIIEEYIERVIESQKQHQLFSPKTTMMKVTEKEQELLRMIQRRDTDVVSAVTLLHISRQKFDTMIQKLLQLEMLQYLSDNEVRLTEKGAQYLSDVHKK
jgi:predicted DNA-binding protein (UPF0251 family)